MQVFKKNKKLRAVKQAVLAPNYTVCGNPVVSDDFIASGFASTNYLKTPNFPTVTNGITISCKFNSGLKETSLTNFIFGWYHSESFSFLRFDFYNNNLFRSAWRDKNLVFGKKQIEMLPDTDHELKVTLTNSAVECYLDGVFWFNEDVEIDFSHLKPEYFTLGTMNVANTWFLENGSIDLKNFKVFDSDNNLVFSTVKTNQKLFAVNEE